jgi:hypothetical protein
MSSSNLNIQSVTGNESVQPLRSTIITASGIKDELEASNMNPINKLTGYIKPVGEGVIPVVDINGMPILLPANCCIQAIGLGTIGAPLLAGTTIAINTVLPAVNLLPATSIAAINAKLLVVPATTALVSTTSIAIEATAAGSFTAGVAILFNVYYLSLE